MKKLRVLLIVLTMLLVTGCSNNETGKYLPVRIENAETVITENDDGWDSIMKTYKDQIYIELKDNNKMEIRIISDPITGTYKIKDDYITFTIGKDKVKCPIKDNKITFKQDDISVVFEKE